MADASCVYGEEQEDGNFIVYGILFGVFHFQMVLTWGLGYESDILHLYI